MVELLVTIGIFTILTGIVLAKYRTFNTNAEFANASEDVVLALRQAQVYGVGTKRDTAMACGTGTNFECAYGVHFAASTPNQIIIFADRDNNGLYGPMLGEEIEVISWNSSISLTGIKCGLVTDDCVGDVFTGAVMDVTFRRPSPDAYIFDLATHDVLSAGFKTGWITLSDANTSRISTITISAAGQISVQ
ncbi:MAG: hypothetical protein A2937_01690 [Candidatus Yonathbacteria bacterium RIFCSPLOWO2_01_FULL_47_33b]|uniref:General secretion pathway GspH domain-containing protein n=1 Tax=Candidatus Yonathbacteria bacterium RIFCSPLOWO2_01_FULL_47_33b TaxID=1802727 RepID=A0A1G2SI47_9BACT|nr:MAG: hypothetical protein A2937_01690 [Candidatus Yonathbacteria bacterium RIFCSPLOWO2_01_FULL_47_33b]